jgi:NhaP-type Na+/H+ or K+/H+ antiporter
MGKRAEASRHDEIKTGRIGERPYWALHLSLLIRVAHQIGAAVFLAVYLLDHPTPPRGGYATIALISGLFLLAAEWWRHRQIYRELSGMITFVKMVLLGAAYHGFLPPRETVLLAFAIASYGAHAPKLVRHRLLF